MKNPWRFLASWVVLLSLATLAHAEDKQAAKAAFAEGQRRYDLNEFDAALAAFKQAYLAYEEPVFLYNIAQCHRQLGNRAEAIKFYRSYLRKVPDAPNRDEVEKIVGSLESTLAAEKSTKASAPSVAPAAPSPHDSVAAATLTASPPPEPRRTPVYKKWWLWTIVGVVAAGAATGVAVAVTSQRSENSFMPVTVAR